MKTTFTVNDPFVATLLDRSAVQRIIYPSKGAKRATVMDRNPDLCIHSNINLNTGLPVPGSDCTKVTIEGRPHGWCCPDHDRQTEQVDRRALIDHPDDADRRLAELIAKQDAREIAYLRAYGRSSLHTGHIEILDRGEKQ
jgi:hypothetical protein